MKKVMRKVKSQWIVVGLSVLAMSGVCVAASGDDSVKRSPDNLKNSIEITPINQTNGYDWVANNVNEIESEISAQKSTNQEEYVIQWGDTLFGISKATGMPISELVLLNGIANPDLIYTGDLLHGILSKHYENSEKKVTQDSNILTSGKLLSDKELETAKIVTFQTITQYDNSLPAGERHVIQEGLNGYDTIAYDVTYRNGIKENQVETSRITTDPVSEIVVLGTQKTQIQSLLENENVVSFEIINKPDNTLPVGQHEVIQEGMNGYDEVAYDVTYINENEVSRVEVNRTKKDPIAEIVRVGTQVTEVKRITVTENVVPYKDRVDEDNSVPKDEEQIIQPGTDGYDTVTYDVTYINGIEANRIEINRITTAPIKEVVESPPVLDNHKETSTENTVTFQTIIEEDNTLAMGQRIIIQVGAVGYDEVTYDVSYSDGVEVNRIETERITTEPVSEIIRVGTQTVDIKSKMIIENTVAFETIIQEDDTLPVGERKVIQKGTDGFDTVNYEIAYRDGVETGRTEADRIQTAPVSEIIAVGTQLNETKTETVIENIISYETMTRENNTIPVGQSVVVQEGANGYDEVTYAVTYVNGVEKGRTEINRETSEAINRIVNNGVKSGDPVIFTLNKEHFVPTDSYYILSDKLTSLEGTLTNDVFVSEINYKLFDINENELMRRTVDINENWRLSDVGFVLGLNHLEFEIILKDNSKISDSMMVLNVNEDNMDELSLDEEDDDGDGLNNYLESINHTNVIEADSDKDGISDYDELTVTYTDPNEAYSVSSLTRDGELDLDLDGLSNSQELLFGSDYDYYDTDLDGLSDKEESDYRTSPILFDTDHDGLSDYYEVEFNLNPLVADSDQDGIIDANESLTYTFVSPLDTLLTMELTAEAGILTTFGMTEITGNDFLNSAIPGYLGETVAFSLDGAFEKAVANFDLANLINQYSLLDPKLYYYNHEKQLLEEVKDQSYTGNLLTVELVHFSDYILLNKSDFEKVWVDAGVRSAVKEKNAAHTGLDVTLIIDSSGSMMWNDSENLRQDMAINFIKNNLNEQDKVSVIDLDWYSSKVTSFDDSLDESIEAIERLDSSGSTHIYKAIITAVDNYNNNDDNRGKAIVMLTDGKQATEWWAELFYSWNDMYEQVAKAIDYGVPIYTIGLGDESNLQEFDAALLKDLAQKTGGQYLHISEAAEIEQAFDTISEETSRGADQDGDGLSNFEELNVRLGNGSYLLTDPLKPDSDGDGILDGDEIKYNKTIDEAGNVRYYYTIESDPWLTDSDFDGLTDNQEKANGTNPLEKQFSVVENDGYAKLINHDEFDSGIYYKDFIGEGSGKILSWITRLGLYTGNALDAKINYRDMYQNIMLNYLVEASKNQNDMNPNYEEELSTLSESDKMIATQLVEDVKKKNSYYSILKSTVAGLDKENAEEDIKYAEDRVELASALETEKAKILTDAKWDMNNARIDLNILKKELEEATSADHSAKVQKNIEEAEFILKEAETFLESANQQYEDSKVCIEMEEEALESAKTRLKLAEEAVKNADTGEITLYRDIIKATEDIKESQGMTTAVTLRDILDVSLATLSYNGKISVGDTRELFEAIIDVLKDPGKRSDFFGNLNKKLSEKDVDYSRIDLAELGQVDWTHADLTELLPQLDLSKTSLANIDWKTVDPSTIDWEKFDSTKVDLTTVDWSKVGLGQVDFSNVDLSKVDLSNVDFTNLSKANLSNMKVSRNLASKVKENIDGILNNKLDGVLESINEKFDNIVNAKTDLFDAAFALFDIANAIVEVEETISSVEGSFDYLKDNQSILTTIAGIKKDAEINDEQTLAQAANDLAVILVSDSKEDLYDMIIVNKINEKVTSFLKDFASEIVGGVFPMMNAADFAISMADMVFDFSGTAESLTQIFAMGATADALTEATGSQKENQEGTLLNLVYHLYEARKIGDETHNEKEDKNNLFEEALYLLPSYDVEQANDILEETERDKALQLKFEKIAEEVFG